MPSTFSGRARPRVSKRRNISFLPSPASIRRVVHPDSSNVELPVLPDARMDTRYASPANRINNRKWLRATPQWDDGKVLGWRQYEVAQEKLGRASFTRIVAG